MVKQVHGRRPVVGCALAALVMGTGFGTGRAKGDVENVENVEKVTNTSGEPETELEIDVDGDQTSAISAWLNPFGPEGTETEEYMGGPSQTQIELMMGQNEQPIMPGQSVEVGVVDQNTGLVFDGKFWVNPDQSVPVEMDDPTLEGTDLGTGPNTEFELLHGTFLNSGGTLSSEEWTEIQVTKGQTMNVEIGNFDVDLGEPLFTYGLGYLLSPTEIPLDELNSSYYADTMFKPVPGISDGTEIDVGQTVTSGGIDVPEPGSLGILVGGILLAARRNRRG